MVIFLATVHVGVKRRCDLDHLRALSVPEVQPGHGVSSRTLSPTRRITKPGYGQLLGMFV